MMVDIRLSAASTTVISCSFSPESAASLYFLDNSAKNDADIFFLVKDGTPPDAALAIENDEFKLLIGLYWFLFVWSYVVVP